ncbi:MAG: hypothetical protein PWR07_1873 [Bacillota bacterium]|nr:hypothetical protein [Bacillota bacterium]
MIAGSRERTRRAGLPVLHSLFESPATQDLGKREKTDDLILRHDDVELLRLVTMVRNGRSKLQTHTYCPGKEAWFF